MTKKDMSGQKVSNSSRGLALEQDGFNTALLRYLQDSPSPFHAVESAKQILHTHAFEYLDEKDPWQLSAGKRYYTTRNDSSLIAFGYGKKPISQTGIVMMGAHTDSPCLRLKPQGDYSFKNYRQWGVEVYGGAIFSSWFDRDLALAGRIFFLDQENRLQSQLIRVQRPIASVPSLAIHLDPETNRNHSINPQKELVPIFSLHSPHVFENAASVQEFLEDVLVESLQTSRKQLHLQKILAHDLYLYDVQAPAFIGVNNDFIASARLDNLLSCYVGLQTMSHWNEQATCVLALHDHEEVGSTSAIGANGSFLQDVLSRIIEKNEYCIPSLQKSLFISCDNAHAVHPNYAEKHDVQHMPLLNHGPVIKVNSNQRYATNSETHGIFAQACELEGISYQRFVVRSDMGCGSTIGPLSAAHLGVKTIDVGIPTLAMHSIREFAATQDAQDMHKVLLRLVNGSVEK